MCSNHDGIFKVNNLLLDIDRPLPIGTHVTYMDAAREVIQATAVQAGYVCLVVWHDNTVSIILYSDLVSVGGVGEVERLRSNVVAASQEPAGSRLQRTPTQRVGGLVRASVMKCE